MGSSLGGGKGGGKAPAPPDPRATAAAEVQYNRPDAYGADGSKVIQGFTDAEGNFRQGSAPQGMQTAQQVLESDFARYMRGLMEPAAGAAATRIVGDSVNNMPGPAQVQDRSDVAKALFDRSFSMMEPAMEQSQTRLLTNLQARGIPIGGEAFNDAYGEQLRQTQDTISRLGMDSVVQAGGEQTRQFNLDQQQRSNALNEIMGLIGGNFSPAAPLPNAPAGTNIGQSINNQYQSQMAQYQSDQQSKASTKGALGSLGAAAIMSSSRDFKEDMGEVEDRDLARAVMETPVRRWAYTEDHRPPGDYGEDHIGPMAEDFQAATGLGTGKSINLIDANGVLLGALRHALKRIEVLEKQVWANG